MLFSSDTEIAYEIVDGKQHFHATRKASEK